MPTLLDRLAAVCPFRRWSRRGLRFTDGRWFVAEVTTPTHRIAGLLTVAGHGAIDEREIVADQHLAQRLDVLDSGGGICPAGQGRCASAFRGDCYASRMHARDPALVVWGHHGRCPYQRAVEGGE